MHREKTVSAAQAVDTLRRLVEACWTPVLSKAKPVVFDFLTEQWTLDPANPRAMVRKGDTADAPLHLTSSPATLVRLLTEPRFEPEPYQIFAAGDADALLPIIEALRSQQSVVNLRAGKQGV
jgi:hypothetical protein